MNIERFSRLVKNHLKEREYDGAAIGRIFSALRVTAVKVDDYARVFGGKSRTWMNRHVATVEPVQGAYVVGLRFDLAGLSDADRAAVFAALDTIEGARSGAYVRTTREMQVRTRTQTGFTEATSQTLTYYEMSPQNIVDNLTLSERFSKAYLEQVKLTIVDSRIIAERTPETGLLKPIDVSLPYFDPATLGRRFASAGSRKYTITRELMAERAAVIGATGLRIPLLTA